MRFSSLLLSLLESFDSKLPKLSKLVKPSFAKYQVSIIGKTAKGAKVDSVHYAWTACEVAEWSDCALPSDAVFVLDIYAGTSYLMNGDNSCKAYPTLACGFLLRGDLVVA